MMRTATRLLAAAALTGLGVTASLHAQQAQMSFFVTSVGKGNGADLGGLEGADAHCAALASGRGDRQQLAGLTEYNRARGRSWGQRA